MPAIAADQKGDNMDDINDSGMDTMYFQDSPEKEDFNRTAEVLGPRPGKGAFRNDQSFYPPKSCFLIQFNCRQIFHFFMY